MAAIDAARLLRPGLLDGVGVLLAGPPGFAREEEGFGKAVHDACAALGAQVASCVLLADVPGEEQEAASDRAVTGVLAEIPAVEMLIVDAASMHGSRPGTAQLGACMQATWAITRSVFNLALLPAGRGGRILYLAPPAGAGEHSDAARAGLENLSRTLSIEWARHRVTAVTIAPGAATAAGEVGALAAFLVSPAGAYFSGCLLDLRGV
jgi:NAD(P)-dependent dehydrogenase (short-subunit alcohol dehydrogenase family)